MMLALMEYNDTLPHVTEIDKLGFINAPAHSLPRSKAACVANIVTPLAS